VTQILHIFRKDVRHHWPEILASLALLALYTWHEPRTWAPNRGFEGDFLSLLFGLLPVLLPASWCFLILRVVHGENLVGDRQFWVTRPYEWPALLIAKVLFVLLFLNVPFFIADAILLAEASFPPASHLPGLLFMQLLAVVTWILLTATLAAVTRSIGQFLLAVLGGFLCATGISSLNSVVPNAEMHSNSAFPGALYVLLLAGTSAFVVLWQYARRLTWQSRLALCAAAAAVAILTAATPYRTLIARAYPLPPNGQQSLAQFAFDSAAEPPHGGTSTFDKQKGVDIQLPLRMSLSMSEPTSGGQNDLVVIRGIFVAIEGPDGFRANSQWQGEFSILQPDTDHWWEGFWLDKKIFDRIKSEPVNLHVSLALTGYHIENKRDITVQSGEFEIPGIGICAIARPDWPYLSCRAPLKRPVFFATSDAESSTCPSVAGEKPLTGLLLANNGDWDDDSTPADFGIDPVIGFSPQFWSPHGANDKPWKVCPGTPMSFASPKPYQYSRVEFDATGIRLRDYLLKPFNESGSVGGETGVSVSVP